MVLVLVTGMTDVVAIPHASCKPTVRTSRRVVDGRARSLKLKWHAAQGDALSGRRRRG